MADNPQLYVVTKGGQRITEKALPLAEAEQVAAKERQSLMESKDTETQVAVKPFITG